MTYNILEVIFVALALLVLGIFTMSEKRTGKRYRAELIRQFEHEEESGNKEEKREDV